MKLVFEKGGGSRINLTSYGEPVDSLLIEERKKRLANYGLEGIKLVVYQGFQQDLEKVAFQQSMVSLWRKIN